MHATYLAALRSLGCSSSSSLQSWTFTYLKTLSIFTCNIIHIHVNVHNQSYAFFIVINEIYQTWDENWHRHPFGHSTMNHTKKIDLRITLRWWLWAVTSILCSTSTWSRSGIRIVRETKQYIKPSSLLTCWIVRLSWVILPPVGLQHCIHRNRLSLK